MVDQSEISNELAAAEYIKDIYKFYKRLETKGRLCDYMNA